VADKSTRLPRIDLTPADAKKYIDGGAGHCPFCDGISITGDSFDFNGNEVSQNIHCAECGAAWADVYVLNRIEVFDTPDGRTFDPGTYPPLDGPQQDGAPA
jgi:hypothetical protein